MNKSNETEVTKADDVTKQIDQTTKTPVSESNQSTKKNESESHDSITAEELKRKAAELKAREQRMDCIQVLRDYGYTDAVFSIVPPCGVQEFTAKINELKSMIESYNKPHFHSGRMKYFQKDAGDDFYMSQTESVDDPVDPVKEAFKEKPHKPRVMRLSADKTIF